MLGLRYGGLLSAENLAQQAIRGEPALLPVGLTESRGDLPINCWVEAAVLMSLEAANASGGVVLPPLYLYVAGEPDTNLMLRALEEAVTMLRGLGFRRILIIALHPWCESFLRSGKTWGEEVVVVDLGKHFPPEKLLKAVRVRLSVGVNTGVSSEDFKEGVRTWRELVRYIAREIRASKRQCSSTAT